eukprot:5101435-Prorocentrum_lima.AAC.1
MASSVTSGAVVPDPPLREEFLPESIRALATGRPLSPLPRSLPPLDCWDHCLVSRPTWPTNSR